MSEPIIINIGALPNDGTGDPLRTAFNDVNLNFANVFASGPVGSNIQIANNSILTTNTNGNLILNPNGVGVVQANAHVAPDQTRIRNLGSAILRWNTAYVQYANIGGSANIAGNITAGNATFSGDLYVDGNLTVEGTTTTIDSTVVDIKDKNITLAFGSPNAQVANGGGITIAGANALWYYNYPNDSWTSNLTIAPPNITFPDGSVLDTANTAHIGQTPLVKADGNLWFNSDDGRGYIKYNDQWIEFCPPVIPNPATYLGNLTIDGAENSTLYFPPGGAIVFGDDTVQTTAYTGANTDWANIGNINNVNGPTQIAIGQFAGANAQSTNTIAIGVDAGNNTQHDAAIAIGQFAGQDNQGNSAVGLGKWAGQEGQHEYAVAVGVAAGAFSQGNSAVAIGDNSGHTGQKSLAIAIGQQSGYFLQGANAVAIGAHAGDYKQGNNSIILNATGGILDQQTDNTFTVAPVRNDTGNTTNALYYNTATFEISYGPSGGAAGNAGDIQINVAGNIGADSTLRYVDNGGEMTLYADYLNAPGIFTSDIYAGDGTPSNITLTTSYGNATWTFDTIGSLTLPGGSRLRPLGANLDIVAGTGSYVNLITSDESTAVGVDGGGGYITTSGGTWDFDTTGNLTVPGAIRTNSNSQLELTESANTAYLGTTADDSTALYLTATTAQLYANGEVSISSNVGGGNAHGWAFDVDGNTNVPGDIISFGNIGITTNVGNTTSSWTFDDTGNLTLPRGGKLLVSGGIVGGGASPAPSLSGFSSLNAYGNITGGNVLTGGLISASGNITGDYFIGNGSQLTNVAASTTGSWTLDPGTNTVSFTIPTTGTYSIWVNGNISNGIVTYTATIVLTNTNVPVVGSQYGWYYEAGNALVLTSIPNQVVGTNNAISNAVVVTTTANTFTFGITNNSGNSAVVNWGYTKL